MYDTGQRMRKVSEILFKGNMSELARNLEMKPQALTKYSKGESMPGGLILIRLYNLGVNINWFLTGEGEPILHDELSLDSEPYDKFLVRLKDKLSTGEESAFEELLKFSDVVGDLDISPALRRSLILVYARHLE